MAVESNAQILTKDLKACTEQGYSSQWKKKKNKNESEIGPKNTQISESLTKKFEKNGLENAA